MLKFQAERFADTMAEMIPLMGEHFDEVGLNAAPFPVQPNFASYFTMERAGSLHLFTARAEDDALAGYSAFILAPDLIYGGHAVAMNHALYLRRQYRNGFTVKRLIRFGEREMAAKGAEIFEYHLWSDHNFGRLMELVGYEERRITFSKFARKE